MFYILASMLWGHQQGSTLSLYIMCLLSILNNGIELIGFGGPGWKTYILENDPPRTRTWNLRLRRPTPYPLGQRAISEATGRLYDRTHWLPATCPLFPAPLLLGKGRSSQDGDETHPENIKRSPTGGRGIKRRVRRRGRRESRDRTCGRETVTTDALFFVIRRTRKMC